MRQAALALACALLLGGCKAPGDPVATPTPTPEATPIPTQAAKAREFVLPCGAQGDFHPITGENRADLTMAPLLYRGLFALDRQFEAQKELCKSYTVSEDGRTWTFQLVDITFSDGSPLTPREAAASLEQARKSERYAGRLAAISKVTAGDGAVSVTLSAPNGDLPKLLDVPIVKETSDPKRPLGTGPYVLEGEREGLCLVARPGTVVPLQTISLRPMGAGDELVHGFDAGEISLVDTDLTGSGVLGYSGHLETNDYPTTTLLYVGCNTARGLCQDAGLRRAVGLAIDRQDVAGRLLAGHAVAAELPVHPASAGYDAELAAILTASPARAGELLAQAKWVKGDDGWLRKGRGKLSVRLLVNQENTWKVTVAEAVGTSLEALGWTVAVDKLPFEDFEAALKRGDFDLYLGECAMTADFDPAALVGWSGRLNYGKYHSGETEELLSAWRGARGEGRSEAGHTLYAKLAADAPILPVCFKNGSLLTQWGQVSGVQPTQRDVFAGLAGWSITEF